eukprot:gene10251-10056_t
MKKITAQTVYNFLEEVLQAFLRVARFGARLLRRMSPQALLAAALLLAFIVAILPLALVLFVVFMVLKVMVGASFIQGRRDPHSYANAKGLLDLIREIGDTAVTIWWRFFDWLAQVEWRKLIIVWVLLLLLGLTPFGLSKQAVAFIMLSLGLKVLAGGKRKAELDALHAHHQADEESMERRVVEARMAALQAQVEPHFLFNTLALIGQLIETDPPQAARIHQNLIDYLRATLPQMRAAGAGTLGRQIDMSRAYLAIMQARMGARLAVSIDVPQEMLSATFPVMTLQILIENAIKHGLEPKIAGGRIDIRASVEQGVLQVDVLDDGVGFNLHAPDGIGLANVRERLRILYGNRAQLVLEAPLTGGTRASVRLPATLPNRVSALIADDEAPMRAQLRARLQESWPALEIVAEAENG